ncbi:paired immunoglobulin-like type 2 receptor alpha [Monodon monoceros]|uniref:Paired immunoglobulin-like type 2 receptor alpha n=1 Tax=Monodon monoceros TaxID=40151 RepID=A0A8C6AH87_MONMO|nr:paired immunoglobulin-like type 2 receptor alpha [Monodon monoceros]
MGLPLLLTLLLPLASLQAGHWAEPNPNTAFGMNQPKKLSALEGDSIRIPFFFYYPWELHKVPNVNISWRWKHFHGEFIYNTTPMFIHNDFKDRLLLNWIKGGKNGSFQISKLRREDASSYFCRVEMDTQGNGKQVWQSIKGTTLTINPTTNTTIQVPTTTKTTTQGPTTTITTTAGLRVPEGKRSSWSWPLSTEATVGLALASAVLITAIVGLTVYLRWKRSKGLQTKARTPARGSFQNPEEKYENIGNKGQHTGPKLDTKDDGIFYASLTLSSLTSPAAPPHPPPQEGPQEETLYSVIKA